LRVLRRGAGGGIAASSSEEEVCASGRFCPRGGTPPLSVRASTAGALIGGRGGRPAPGAEAAAELVPRVLRVLCDAARATVGGCFGGECNEKLAVVASACACAWRGDLPDAAAGLADESADEPAESVERPRRGRLLGGGTTSDGLLLRSTGEPSGCSGNAAAADAERVAADAGACHPKLLNTDRPVSLIQLMSCDRRGDELVGLLSIGVVVVAVGDDWGVECERVLLDTGAKEDTPGGATVTLAPAGTVDPTAPVARTTAWGRGMDSSCSACTGRRADRAFGATLGEWLLLPAAAAGELCLERDREEVRLGEGSSSSSAIPALRRRLPPPPAVDAAWCGACSSSSSSSAGCSRSMRLVRRLPFVLPAEPDPPAAAAFFACALPLAWAA